MAIKEFTILLENQLNCGRCDSILLKLVDPQLLVINQGAPVEDIKSFLRASIVKFEEVAQAGTCAILYRYTISYEDSLLLDPDTLLRDCDIERVCCVDCILDYVDEQGISNHVLISPSQGVVRLVRPDTTFDDVPVSIFTNLPITGDGLSGTPVDLLISTDADNQLILGTDNGVFVPEFTVQTDATVDGDGSAGSPLSVPVSSDVGNLLTLGSDSKHFISAAALPESVVNTDATINGDGSAGSPLSAPVSVDAGNIIVLGTDSKHYAAPYTAYSDEVGFTDTNTPHAFDSASPFTSDVLGLLVIDNALFSRPALSDIEIFFRPNFVFENGEDSEITIFVDVRINGGAWTTLSSEIIRYNLTGGVGPLSFSVDKNERIFESVAGGSNKTVEARFRMTSPNPAIVSRLQALNGSIKAFTVSN